LQSDQDFEAIPEPWTDAVAYVATALAYESLQNLNFASYHWKQFYDFMGKYSDYARVARAPSPYQRRYLWWAAMIIPLLDLLRPALGA